MVAPGVAAGEVRAKHVTGDSGSLSVGLVEQAPVLALKLEEVSFQGLQ
jgi:hypothetical protein